MKREALLIAMLACTGCGEALAQFGASGGSSPAVDRLVELPWLLVAAIAVLAWIGPEGLRPMLRKALKRAFGIYVLMEAALLACLIVLRAVYGPNTEPLLNLSGLFLTGLLFSGVLIAALMTASVLLGGVQAALARIRNRPSARPPREGS